MRPSTFLVLFAVGLLVRGISSESCFVPSESNLKASGACMSKNVTLFSAKDEFTINFSGNGSKQLFSNMTLKIGGCDMSSVLFVIPGGGLLTFGNNGTLTFPIVATVSSSNIKFIGSASGVNPPDLYSTACAPVFTKVKGGFSTEFQLGLSVPTPGFTMILNAVSIYKEPAKKEESLAAFKIAIIVTGSIALSLVLLAVSGFGSFRFYQFRKEKRANEQAALKKPTENKPEMKPTENKPAMKPPKHEPVVKKVDETKSNKPTVAPIAQLPPITFLPGDDPRTAEDEVDEQSVPSMLPTAAKTTAMKTYRQICPDCIGPRG